MLMLVPRAIAQDFQLWNEVDLAASWKKVEFLAPFLARSDTSLPNPQLAATGITADFPLPWRLTLTGGYLFADLPQRSLFVHLPLVAVTKGGAIGRFTVADRNRFEKLVGFGTAPVRYRNRLLVDRAFGAHDRWHLFAGDELFFDLSAGAWNQNRLQAGGGARLNRRLLLDVYYLQRDASGLAPTTRALGTTLRVTLTPKPEGTHPRPLANPGKG
jgi:Protein of unknown function (DUF2490)